MLLYYSYITVSIQKNTGSKSQHKDYNIYCYIACTCFISSIMLLCFILLYYIIFYFVFIFMLQRLCISFKIINVKYLKQIIFIIMLCIQFILCNKCCVMLMHFSLFVLLCFFWYDFITCYLYGHFCNSQKLIVKGFKGIAHPFFLKKSRWGRLPPQFSEKFEMILRGAEREKKV